jgi:hypothetical protein
MQATWMRLLAPRAAAGRMVKAAAALALRRRNSRRGREDMGQGGGRRLEAAGTAPGKTMVERPG